MTPLSHSFTSGYQLMAAKKIDPVLGVLNVVTMKVV